jgi:hypothetical protein
LASASYRLFERPIRNAVLAISANRAHGVSRPSMPS